MVKKRSPWRLIFVSLVVVLAGCFVVGVFSPQDLSAAKSLEPQTEEVLPETATGRAVASRHLPLPGMNPYLIADIAEQVSPAVVFISVEWPPVQQYSHPFINDPFFRFFFGDMFPFPMQPGETTPGQPELGLSLTKRDIS